jgi:hypothetical protein
VVTLHVGDSETRVVSQRANEPANTIVLAIGYAAPGQQSLRHEPPTDFMHHLGFEAITIPAGVTPT